MVQLRHFTAAHARHLHAVHVHALLAPRLALGVRGICVRAGRGTPMRRERAPMGWMA